MSACLDPPAGATLRALTARRVCPTPDGLTREAFCDPRNGASLDDGLVLWFPRPPSFNGEDVVELHITEAQRSSPPLWTLPKPA